MTKQSEAEGFCGWCGLYDSHLLDETCPQCQQKITTLGDNTDDYDDVPLGVEAADTTLPGNRDEAFQKAEKAVRNFTQALEKNGQFLKKYKNRRIGHDQKI